jgi:hypothetical protein
MPRRCHGAANHVPPPFAPRFRAWRARVAGLVLPVNDARRRLVRIAQTMLAQANDSPN